MSLWANILVRVTQQIDDFFEGRLAICESAGLARQKLNSSEPSKKPLTI